MTARSNGLRAEAVCIYARSLSNLDEPPRDARPDMHPGRNGMQPSAELVCKGVRGQTDLPHPKWREAVAARDLKTLATEARCSTTRGGDLGAQRACLGVRFQKTHLGFAVQSDASRPIAQRRHTEWDMSRPSQYIARRASTASRVPEASVIPFKNTDKSA